MYPETDDVELQVNTVKQIFQMHSPSMINLFKQNIYTIVAPEQSEIVIYLALFCLAETDPESFTWALHHYDRDFYQQLKEKITAYAIQQLIAVGFLPGQDFSSLPGGDLIVHRRAYRILLQQSFASAFVHLLLKDILRIVLSPACN